MVLPTALVAVFVGTYSLVGTSTRTTSGQVIADAPLQVAFGQAPVGWIQYTAHGDMSAVIAATEPELRPTTLTCPPPPEPVQPDADWALLGKHTTAYAGPYYFRDGATNTSGVVVHGPLAVATLPAASGRDQVRNYTFSEKSGVTLLTLEYNINDELIASLVWEKMPSRLEKGHV